MDYARSPFRTFESYLRIVVGSDEEVIQLILKQWNTNFVTYEIDPGKYTIKDLQEAVNPLGDLDGTLKNEFDDFSIRTKLILTRFGGTFGTLRVGEKCFLYFIRIYKKLDSISLLMQCMLIAQVYITVIKL